MQIITWLFLHAEIYLDPTVYAMVHYTFQAGTLTSQLPLR